MQKYSDEMRKRIVRTHPILEFGENTVVLLLILYYDKVIEVSLLGEPRFYLKPEGNKYGYQDLDACRILRCDARRGY